MAVRRSRRRAVCVCLPAPSPPSTTKMRPGDVGGVRKSSMADAADESSAYSWHVRSGWAFVSIARTADVPRRRRHSTGMRHLCSAYATSAPTVVSDPLMSATSASEPSKDDIHSASPLPTRTGPYCASRFPSTSTGSAAGLVK
eukprot:scaffold10152_cov108-Isochrysis_galbana.AAC.2